MCENHERVLLDDEVLVRKTFVKLIAILINDIAERHSNISESDHDIAADIGIL